MEPGTRERIYEIIKSELNRDPAEIDPAKDLREQVLLDSMQFVALLARLENDLKIEIPITALESNTLNQFLDVVNSELDKNKSS
jgi:acyl carrier protein